MTANLLSDSSPPQLNLLRKVWAAYCLLLIATTFFPIYVPRNQTHASTMYGMNSVALVILCIGSFSIALYFALKIGTRAWIVSLFAVIGGVISNIVLSELGNPNQDTQPVYTGIVIALYIVVLVFIILCVPLIAAIRYRLKQNPRISQDVQTKKITKEQAKKERLEMLLANAKAELQSRKISHLNGALLAIGGPIVGALIALGLWEVGFIASFSAYVMVQLIIKLYQKGSGSKLIDRRALIIILSYTLFGLLLSAFAVFTSDTIHEIIKEAPKGSHVTALNLLTNSKFWPFNFRLIADPTILRPYLSDILIALGMTGLGLYGTVTSVLLPSHIAAKQAGHELGKPNQKPVL